MSFSRIFDDPMVPGAPYVIEDENGIREKIVNNEINLNLGCGDIRYRKFDNYFNCDMFRVHDLEVLLNLNSVFLPFKDNSIQHILLFAVVNHVDNPTKLLDEIHRILKIGGTLSVSSCTCTKKHNHEFEMVGTFRKVVA